MKKSLTLLVSALLFSLPLSMHAQQLFGAHIQYNHTSSSMYDKGYDHGEGLGLEFFGYSMLKNNKRLMLEPGLRFDVGWHGSAETPAVAVEQNTGELYDVSVENMNMGLYGALRVRREVGKRLSVYADGLIGARAFFSSEEGSNPESNNDCPKLDLNSLNRSFTPSVGASLGAWFYLFDDISLDLRATYIQNGSVTFVDLNSVGPRKGDHEAYSYRLRRSVGGQLMLQLGIQMSLDN